ncbi:MULTISPECIES: hydroxyacylglutathione hydrolase [unclassified Vibrio]|uniref:Hydroxyacylglutathione hydrolase n=1 Tax=Vibrio sp. HB236076 TaxID=3232307 RepID=A0AB39HH15_9VIBR|nr:hydroxyacylglutathione hydrolase [Vibrio sp. HB161653]MDP5254836.1 hydroxyacylglutathione hydrolase [Vibrio sp. HB161653]
MLHVKSIPAFDDNYIWIIHNQAQRVIAVDPGQAQPVLDYLTEHQLKLDAVLLTHHHNDHIGGVPELVRQFPDLKVYGPEDEPIATVNHPVRAGDKILLGIDTVFEVLSLPGHTLGHIGYYGHGAVFCGDVLFAAGCGRLFEGSPEQMFTSLQTLANLPDQTQVYCGHEYTASNVTFSLAVEPDNTSLQAYRDTVNRLRVNNTPTLPTSIEQEKAINPFLRTHVDSVINSVKEKAQGEDPLSIFTALRQWKNEF